MSSVELYPIVPSFVQILRSMREAGDDFLNLCLVCSNNLWIPIKAALVSSYIWAYVWHSASPHFHRRIQPSEQ